MLFSKKAREGNAPVIGLPSWIPSWLLSWLLPFVNLSATFHVGRPLDAHELARDSFSVQDSMHFRLDFITPRSPACFQCLESYSDFGRSNGVLAPMHLEWVKWYEVDWVQKNVIIPLHHLMSLLFCWLRQCFSLALGTTYVQKFKKKIAFCTFFHFSRSLSHLSI